LPKQYFPAKVSELAAGYMYPSFYQGWSLFAPDVPKWHSDLEYRYYYQGQWNDWQSSSCFPGGEGHPVQARIAQKLNHYLTNQLRDNLYYENKIPQFDKVVTQGHYRGAVYLVRAELKKLNQENIDSLQLKLNVSYAPKPGSGAPAELRTVEYPILSTQQAN